MSMRVIVTLSDEVYRWAERLAQLTSRDIADVLADTIELSLSPLDPQPEPVRPVSNLANEEVLALTELELEPNQEQRFSTLLDRQQVGILTIAERSELLALMQIYQENLLRKAQALREAVQRGLREPLTP
jgi:hypothetical protein